LLKFHLPIAQLDVTELSQSIENELKAYNEQRMIIIIGQLLCIKTCAVIFICKSVRRGIWEFYLFNYTFNFFNFFYLFIFVHKSWQKSAWFLRESVHIYS